MTVRGKASDPANTFRESLLLPESPYAADALATHNGPETAPIVYPVVPSYGRQA